MDTLSYIPESALPDKSTFTEGTTQLTPVGGEYNDAATSPASGQAAVARITPNRAIHANLRNQSGAEIATSSNPVRVDPTGSTTQPVSGSVTVSSLPALPAGANAIGSVSVSNFPGTQPVSGTVTANAGAGTFNTTDANAQSQGSTTSGQKGFLELGAVSTAAPTYTNGQSSPLSLTTAGALRTDSSAVTQPISGSVAVSSLPALPAGANAIGSVSVSNFPATQPVSQSGSWTIQNVPGTSGGWSVSSQVSLTNTVVVIKSSAGLFGGYMLLNSNASAVYIQVFDAASPTLGTTTPTFVISLPAGAGANLEIALGITMANAIRVAVTTTPTGSTAPATALTGFFLFK